MATFTEAITNSHSADPSTTVPGEVGVTRIASSVPVICSWRIFWANDPSADDR